MKRVLIACEESQRVCIEFRKLGFEAYSADIQDCSGGHPEWHIKGDCLPLLNDKWDLVIAHPPCTYFSCAGVRWFKTDNERINKMHEMEKFFLEFVRYGENGNKICIENVRFHKYVNLPKYTQEIQPFMFGEPYKKATRLWLYNLPKLKPTNIVQPKYLWVSASNYGGVCCKAKDRAKTFKGIAQAMAEQWGGII